MGQVTSNLDAKTASSEIHTEAASLSKLEVKRVVHERFRASIRAVEAKAIANKTNITRLDEKNVLTTSDLAYLLQISSHKDDDISSIGAGFGRAVRVIYESVKLMGSFPFLRDVDSSGDHALVMDDLIVASVFHSGRYKKFLGDYDYFKLIFISLSSQLGQLREPAEKESEEPFYSVNLYSRSPEDTPLVKRVVWKSIEAISSFDQIDVSSLSVNGTDLVALLTLFLILSVIQKSARIQMQAQLNTLLKDKWAEFEESALSILGYLDLSVNSDPAAQHSFTYDQLNSSSMVKPLLLDGFLALFKNGLLSANFEDSNEPQEDQQILNSKKSVKFTETRLVTYASISLISSILRSIGRAQSVAAETLIKLYTGKESGFSIRSLEAKIFKWHAPTIVIVAGKRLKHKTATTNRRYQQFDSEYPRFFRPAENNRKSWQGENDKVTYAVLLTEPWRASNKKNFGNDDTIIMSLAPHVDYFSSNKNPNLEGKSIYFNTLGMGLGFGNEQPINKNGVKKFLPGDVSLTIEANLEFAVFRHALSGANHATYFKRSSRQELASEDFEDRFMITDLEVWGIGSTKVLDEQKKQWEFEKKMAEARQSVNMRNVGEERAFLEMVGLVGNHGSGGSV